MALREVAELENKLKGFGIPINGYEIRTNPLCPSNIERELSKNGKCRVIRYHLNHILYFDIIMIDNGAKEHIGLGNWLIDQIFLERGVYNEEEIAKAYVLYLKKHGTRGIELKEPALSWLK